MFRFGAFEFSPAARELRRNGVLVRLAPQPFQVLLLLLERSGELITRDELCARLWGSAETNVEFDAGVNRCIRQIRAALNDSSDLGYQSLGFVSDVLRGHDCAAADHRLRHAPKKMVLAVPQPVMHDGAR